MFWCGVLILLLGSVYVWFAYVRLIRYFAARDVVSVTPWPILGNVGSVVLRRKPYHTALHYIYERFKHKGVYGIYDMLTPILMVCDPELIKRVTVQDFDHFADHRKYIQYPEYEPMLGKSLFCMNGDRWRNMRSTLTSIFTGSRIRTSFTSVTECSRRYTDFLRNGVRQTNAPYVVEMKDLTMRFANDVIASTAFGIQVDSLMKRDNQFYEMTLNSTEFNSPLKSMKFWLQAHFPRMLRLFGIRLFSMAEYTFYNRMSYDTMRTREENGIVRPDLIEALMQARRIFREHESNQRVTGDEMGSEDMRGFQGSFWDDDDVMAQCYVFIFGGSDKISTLLSFAVYELMVNRAVQDRLFAELTAATRKLRGEPMNYEALVDLPYLDMVVSETLRKWSPESIMDRMCTKDYSLLLADGRVIQLKKGDIIGIPMMSMHYDPNLFPNPNIFDPERFGPERLHTIQPFTFLPFGSGPRNCIGIRLFMMEAKVFLYDLLMKFSLGVGRPDEVPIQLAGGGLMLHSKNGINVWLRLREDERVLD